MTWPTQKKDDQGINCGFPAEKAAWAPLMQIPVGMVQVTGPPLKQTAVGGRKENDLFACFCLSGKKNRK